jgi:ribonucleoside-diphosphate reductase alpha chain
VLNLAAEEEQGSVLEPRRRARVTKGITERVATGCGNIYVTVNSDDYGICEVFSSLGKAGGCASAQLEAISRLISLALRSGVDVAAVVKHIKGIRCPSIAWEQGHSVLSCPDAIASVLERQIKKENEGDSDSGEADTSGYSGEAMKLGGQCPECGGILVYQEGCQICHGCGYTKCS